MTFCALDSALTGPLFATDAMRAVFSDRARVAAMLKVEAALARGEAAKDLAPKALAGAIERIAPEDLDLAALGAKTAAAGMPTIPFVKAVEAKLPAKLRGDFHKGATSQDVLDTALVLQVGDALDLIADDLAAIVPSLSRLARAHRKTPHTGRTYGQHAVPVTFGYVAATWLSGIAQVAAGLPCVRERMLVASLGGPAGTLSSLGGKGPAVMEAFARDLGLAAPALPWHATRARVAETGAWLAVLIGALAKMATDVVFLSSTEVGEVSEPHVAGRGGSSAMPHKRNPVAATVILAAHTAAPGHVVTLLTAMAAGGQRPAGAWHAEWHALPQIFGLASGALREARRLAEGLVVDKRRMRANLDLTRGLLFAEAAAAALAPKLGREAAHKLVEAAADKVRTTRTPLRDVLRTEPGIPPSLRKDVDAAFDLAPSLDAAAVITDRVLSGMRPVTAILRGDAEMATLSVNGVDLNYDISGPEGAPVVVFSNSLGSATDMWDAVVPALAGRYRCLRYDTRGHGRSGSSDNAVSIDDLAGDLLGLLDALAIGKAHVVGLSLGGMTGQALASRYSERVASLVLIATAAHLPPVDFWEARAKTVRADGPGAVVDIVIPRWFTEDFRERAPEAVARVRRSFMLIDRAGYARCCEAIGAMDLRNRLAKIAAPTLVMVGADDPVTTPAIAETLRMAIPQAELVVIPACAHLVSVERPDTVVAYLLAFLGRQDSGAAVVDDAFQKGLVVRKSVLGADYVDVALKKAGAFGAEWQDFITRVAWGEIWGDTTLPKKTRSLLVLAMMTALHRQEEFKIHLRPALGNGVTIAELCALIKQAAVYAGVPAGNAAMRWVREELGEELE